MSARLGTDFAYYIQNSNLWLGRVEYSQIGTADR